MIFLEMLPEFIRSAVIKLSSDIGKPMLFFVYFANIQVGYLSQTDMSVSVMLSQKKWVGQMLQQVLLLFQENFTVCFIISVKMFRTFTSLLISLSRKIPHNRDCSKVIESELVNFKGSLQAISVHQFRNDLLYLSLVEYGDRQWD